MDLYLGRKIQQTVSECFFFHIAVHMRMLAVYPSLQVHKSKVRIICIMEFLTISEHIVQRFTLKPCKFYANHLSTNVSLVT